MNHSERLNPNTLDRGRATEGVTSRKVTDELNNATDVQMLPPLLNGEASHDLVIVVGGQLVEHLGICTSLTTILRRLVVGHALHPATSQRATATGTEESSRGSRRIALKTILNLFPDTKTSIWTLAEPKQ